MSYTVGLHEDAARGLEELDNSVSEKLIKRMARMREEEPGRHLHHGLPYFVEEVGQYRLAYTCRGNAKTVYFAGDHKSYEKWLRKQAQTA